MSLFDKEGIKKILSFSDIGLWKVEFEDGKPPRFYADDVLDELMGTDPNLTPEERFTVHHSCIHPDDREMFEDYSNKLASGRSEVVYRFIHPTLGERFVRCGGMRDMSVTDFISVSGTHQDITDTMRLEQGHMFEKRLAEENRKLNSRIFDISLANMELEEQLDIIKTLSTLFNTVYYIDLNERTFVELGECVEEVSRTFGTSGKTDSLFEGLMKQYMKEEYHGIMADFLNLDTLDERFGDKHFISQQFEGTLMGWTEAYFLEVHRDDDGQLEHVIWATKNIDEIKRKDIAQQEALIEATEKAQAANEAKTTFLFNMSHDIRTPMNAIIGYADLIEKHQDDPWRRADYLNKLNDASNVLLSIINNVLEMSRIEKGTLESSEVAWCTEDFNNDIYTVFREMMHQKGITFIKEINVEHHYVFCDPIKLREVFINIISNAYKYTKSGGTVKMVLDELPSGKEGYVVYKTTISDTGMGMSEEFIPHIFEEFSREHTTTDIKIEGTGLGMPIVKRLVDFMGGTIEVHSQKDKGSTFIVTISHRIASKSDIAENNQSDKKEISLNDKHILLAEDNELNAEITLEILREAGLNIDHAWDGKQCVDMLRKSAQGYYDLILMDIQMPNMNGYEATRAIRALEDKEKADIPILAITANAFEEDKRAAIDAGMNGHLGKPINTHELMNAMTDLLSR